MSNTLIKKHNKASPTKANKQKIFLENPNNRKFLNPKKITV